MSSQTPRDFTPESAAPTDIAPLGRTGSKPAHEMTAEEERGSVDWDVIAADADFKKLLAAKIRFILPMTIFFLVYYFTLPVLVGWFPDFMKTRVGNVNVAYLFAFSQFFMAWIVAGIYVSKAAGWDKDAAAVLAKFKK
ncbi:MAG: DUF485 domain-containing protein [Chthoniobacter sp.]|uniref:DUF485 domain-containing protein n=1 Tax=Chthoniobacter sp. TaxID=2510640 RepID=UPI0032A4EBCD